ncbi:MAG: Kelch repeat-containing protein [Planctomycetota bacterium]
MNRLPVLCAALAGAVLPAQNVFHGNGVPSAYVQNTPGVLGQQLVVGFGSPTTPLPLAILSVSDGVGPVFVPHPLLGNIGLDLFSPAFQALTFPLDPNGHGSAQLLLPPGFPLASDPPLFLQAATFEATGLSISKTVRVEWANPNAWEPVAPLSTARGFHTATALGSGPRDNVTEVLLCGGSSGTFLDPVPSAAAELYSPLLRSMSPLPTMAIPRSMHAAVRLPDGRVLITGGITTGGLVTATCELFDPNVGAFTAAPSMLAARAAHAATPLDDGRVLVTGGAVDWQSLPLAQRWTTILASAEVFDPVAGTWSPLPSMATPRFGHTQTLLPDGRVVVFGGFYRNYLQPAQAMLQPTNVIEVFEPGLPMFVWFLPGGFNGRALHGASLLSDGTVAISGGFQVLAGHGVSFLPAADLFVFDPATGQLQPRGALPLPLACHTQVPSPGGALIVGGLAQVAIGFDTSLIDAMPATAVAYEFNGTGLTLPAAIGTDGFGGIVTPCAGHTCVPLYDGTFLLHGGFRPVRAEGFVYTPQ